MTYCCLQAEKDAKRKAKEKERKKLKKAEDKVKQVLHYSSFSVG